MENFFDETVDVDLQNAIKEYCNNVKHSKSKNTEKYQVLSTDEIVEYVVEYVQEVNNIVQLAPTVTRMLLSHCKWDKILIMEKFYNDPDKLFHDAHVINPFNISNNSIAESESNECEICLCELISSSTATNACGHRFCSSCWSEYLKVKIMDEGVGNSILCAATDCDVVIDDDTVIELVHDSQAKSRYQHLITNSFVQQNLLLRWCPAPGCSFAIKVDFRPFKPMACNCKCGHEFCFDCGDPWHGPVPCDLLKRFNVHLKQGLFNPVLAMNKDYGYDDKIKTCPNPNCTVSIQKIFGCHAMHCTNCSTIFCWVCMKSFKTKAGVYQHACKGETPTEDDETKSTETNKKKNDSDESEVPPPPKYVKTSTVKPSVSAEVVHITGCDKDEESSSRRKADSNESELPAPKHVKISTDTPGVSSEVIYLSDCEEDEESSSLRKADSNESELPPPKYVKISTDKPGASSETIVLSENEEDEESSSQQKADVDESELPPTPKYVKVSTDKPGVSSEIIVLSENEKDEQSSSRQKAVGNQQEYKTTGRVEETVRRKNKLLEMNGRLVNAPAWAKIPTFATVPNRQCEHEADRHVPQQQHIHRHNRGEGDRWNDLFGLGHPIRNVGMRMQHPARNFQLLNVGRHRTRATIYYHKYNTEDAHYKAASTLSVRIKQALQLLEEATPNLTQLKMASVLLAECRQTLKYSAIFAMYLKKVDASLIFENLYRDLEDATTELSDSMAYVDVQIRDNHPQIPDSIAPAHRNCTLRRKALLDYIDDGYDNEWWIFEDQPT